MTEQTVWHAPEPPTTDKHGSEVHPAWGVISASKVSATPGVVLFDSDIKHGRFVRLTVQRASRQRSGSHDYIHGGGRDLIEVDLSEAQWASFVSSMNTTGVPCTIRRTETDWNVAGVEYAPRLAQSMGEVKGAAADAFRKIREARDAYEEALEQKLGAKITKERLRALHYAIENSAPNVHHAAKTLVEHTENVVQKARADIEAMVMQKAEQLGLEASQARGLVELPAMSVDTDVLDEAADENDRPELLGSPPAERTL